MPFESLKSEPSKVLEATPTWEQRVLNVASTGVHEVQHGIQKEFHDHPWVATAVAGAAAVGTLRGASKFAELFERSLPSMSIVATSESQALRASSLGAEVPENFLDAFLSKNHLTVPIRVVPVDTIREAATIPEITAETTGGSAIATESQTVPFISLGGSLSKSQWESYFQKNGLFRDYPNPVSTTVDRR